MATEIFGPYQVGPKVGEGDMGHVHQARDTRTDQVVALKILDQFDLRGKFDREAAMELIEFAASIQYERLHPILQVIESDADQGKLGIAMPVASGRSLWDHLKSGRSIPQKNAVQIIGAVAAALDFLHRQEVAHGAVKPSNVLLDRSGTATLTDLPMAHLRELGLRPAAPTELQQYYLLTEATYFSPPSMPDDVFALAVLAFHLLTGRLPFDDPRVEARGIPPEGGLPSLVHAVLLRGMTDNVHLRYESIAALMQDFKGAFRGKIDEQTEHWFLKETPPPPDSDELPPST
ncbi:MAG: protein kinase [Chloroflexi bacterium]|nr:protein kinase [Chloroflexota bacterium]